MRIVGAAAALCALGGSLLVHALLGAPPATGAGPPASPPVVVPVASASTASPAVADGPAAPVGVPLVVPAARLQAALSCAGDLADPAAPVPTLLVHGSGGTAREAWSASLQPELARLGHAVCTVDLPNFGVEDVQLNVEYVVHAIRAVNDAAGRPVAVVGLSKGAFETSYALRFWPDLAARVDDVVGLAGVYETGSQRVDDVCDRPDGCVPAFHQISRGSMFLDRLGDWPLLEGPSYSLLGTLEDRTVTPQPTANRQPGATSILVEQVCPGRGDRFELDHGTFVGDAVAHRLLLDALANPGPADPQRIDAAVCEQHYFPGFDVKAYRDGQAQGRTFRQTVTPPTTRCYLDRGCADAASRGRVTARPSVVVSARRVVYRATVVRSGSVSVALAGRRVVRRVEPGAVTIALPRPRATRDRPRDARERRRAARAQVLRVTTDLPAYSAWALELSRRVPAQGR